MGSTSSATNAIATSGAATSMPTTTNASTKGSQSCATSPIGPIPGEARIRSKRPDSASILVSMDTTTPPTTSGTLMQTTVIHQRVSDPGNIAVSAKKAAVARAAIASAGKADSTIPRFAMGGRRPSRRADTSAAPGEPRSTTGRRARASTARTHRPSTAAVTSASIPHTRIDSITASIAGGIASYAAIVKAPIVATRTRPAPITCGFDGRLDQRMASARAATASAAPPSVASQTSRNPPTGAATAAAATSSPHSATASPAVGARRISSSRPGAIPDRRSWSRRPSPSIWSSRTAA